MDCCIPNIERIGAEAQVSSRDGVTASAPQAGPVNDFVRLEGEFLMGTRGS